jgi:hypothetical protein
VDVPDLPEELTLFAIVAGVLFLISFVLHWVNKGSAPFDYIGLALLGFIALSVHLYLHYPWWPRRQPPA